MKIIIRFIIFLGLIIVTSCCTHKTMPAIKIEEPGYPVVKEENMLPDYIANPPQNNAAYIYGTGSGDTLEQAKKMAVNEIIQFFKVYVENEYNDYMQSLEINNTEYFQSYITNKLKVLSHLTIPGISFAKTDHIGNTFYALAILDKVVFDSYQTSVRQEVNALCNQAEAEQNPGRKLQLYFQAASLLTRLVQPFEREEQPVFIAIAGQIITIYEKLESSYRFEDYSQFSEYEGLIITITAWGMPLSGIPLTISGNTAYADKDGEYYLTSSLNQPYDLLISINPDKIELSPELTGKEIEEAKKIVNTLCFYKRNIHIIPPVKLQAFIKIDNYLDYQKSENPQLVNMIKQYLLEMGIFLAADQYDANLFLNIKTETKESSYNDFLGYCYKAGATISISGEERETIVLELNDLQTEEATKSFSQRREHAAKTAQEELNNLLLQKIKEINLKE